MSSLVNNTIENINSSTKNCRQAKPLLPNFAPTIGSLSVTTSIAGQYSIVYIFGSNFFPNGITYVNFGTYQNIPVTYYGSTNISFVVPINAPVGYYNVVVVSIYNGQFSTPVKYTYAGNLNYSNSVTYTIT